MGTAATFKASTSSCSGIGPTGSQDIKELHIDVVAVIVFLYRHAFLLIADIATPHSNVNGNSLREPSRKTPPPLNRRLFV